VIAPVLSIHKQYIDAVILHIGDINVEENADCCWMHVEVEIIQQDLY